MNFMHVNELYDHMHGNELYELYDHMHVNELSDQCVMDLTFDCCLVGPGHPEGVPGKWGLTPTVCVKYTMYHWSFAQLGDADLPRVPLYLLVRGTRGGTRLEEEGSCSVFQT